MVPVSSARGERTVFMMKKISVKSRAKEKEMMKKEDKMALSTVALIVLTGL